MNRKKSIELIKGELIASVQRIVENLRIIADETIHTIHIDGKWSIAQNVQHLVLSIDKLAKGMCIPKKVLKGRFGTTSSPGMSYDEIKNLYKSQLKKGAEAPLSFSPDSNLTTSKDHLLSELDTSMKSLITGINKWNSMHLDLLVMPHPILGNLSLRELLYFTKIHNDHHFEQVQRLILKSK